MAALLVQPSEICPGSFASKRLRGRVIQRFKRTNNGKTVCEVHILASGGQVSDLYLLEAWGPQASRAQDLVEGSISCRDWGVRITEINMSRF